MTKILTQAVTGAIAFGLLAGCGSGNTTAPKERVSRYYVLATVDLKYLPVTLSTDQTSSAELESGSIVLTDSVYTRSLTLRVTYAAKLNKPVQRTIYSDFGIFKLGNTVIDFEPRGGSAAQLPWAREASLFSSTISYAEGGHNYEFQIQ